MDRRREMNPLEFPSFMDRVETIDVEIYGRNRDAGSRKENNGFFIIFMSRLVCKEYWKMGVFVNEKDPFMLNFYRAAPKYLSVRRISIYLSFKYTDTKFEHSTPLNLPIDIIVEKGVGYIVSYRI